MKWLLRISIIGGLAILSLTLGVYAWRHPAGAKQFEYAFGITPPVGVHDVVAYRRWPGGPGDRLVLLHFSADRAAIEKTVAARPLELDPHIVEDTLGAHKDVPRFWRSIFSTYFDYGGAEWQIPTKLVAPEVYEWRGSHPKITLITLLWDAATREAFALYLIG